jgi:hypothetical protein
LKIADANIHQDDYVENQGLVKVGYIDKLKHRAKKDWKRKNGISERDTKCPLVDMLRKPKYDV